MAKYDPLHAHLAKSANARIKLSFDEMDQLVGGLPASARKHRPWGANEMEGSHVQARSWMNAGYEVAEVALGSWVVFVRSSQ